MISLSVDPWVSSGACEQPWFTDNGLGFWCLMPLSTIYELYRGSTDNEGRQMCNFLLQEFPDNLLGDSTRKYNIIQKVVNPKIV